MCRVFMLPFGPAATRLWIFCLPLARGGGLQQGSAAKLPTCCRSCPTPAPEPSLLALLPGDEFQWEMVMAWHHEENLACLGGWESMCAPYGHGIWSAPSRQQQGVLGQN